MTGKIMPLRERDTSTVQAAADAFLLGGEGPGALPRSHLLQLDGAVAADWSRSVIGILIAGRETAVRRGRRALGRDRKRRAEVELLYARSC